MHPYLEPVIALVAALSLFAFVAALTLFAEKCFAGFIALMCCGVVTAAVISGDLAWYIPPAAVLVLAIVVGAASLLISHDSPNHPAG